MGDGRRLDAFPSTMEVFPMLTITHQAAVLLEEQRHAADAPDTFGVRLFAATPPGGGAARVAVAFVPEAEPGDAVTEQEGVKAFVASDVTEVLNEAILDASPVDGGVELVIHN
jgi:Fe-S cluster assembly iron-binding protein IscA